MSWESATRVLYSELRTLEQVEALSEFISQQSKVIARFYEPEYRELRPIISRFVSRLFELFEQKVDLEGEVNVKLAEAVEKAVDLLVPKEFFKGLFHYALNDADEVLLELVYSLLFSEITFNSPQTSLWFDECLSAMKNGVEFPPLARALNVLASVQFLDVGQDWKSVQPRSGLLASLDSSITKCDEAYLQLVWNLALFFMAQQHYKFDTESDGGAEIEAIMERLQSQSGRHWSAVLQDTIQMNVGGINDVIDALVVVRSSQSLKIVSHQVLSQTVADVISCLGRISKPTEALCTSLSLAVRDYPDLTEQVWTAPEEALLIKSKCPASFNELILLGQTMSAEKRVEFFKEMNTYVCEVGVESLDVTEALDLSIIGQTVRNTKFVTILPPRVSDKQGMLDLDVGTRGTVLGYDGTECLVMWHFTYNGWSLIGRIFENSNLIEGSEWQQPTLETLRLIQGCATDISALVALSSGLERGDIVDLVGNRLKQWMHEVQQPLAKPTAFKLECISVAFDFLAAVAKIDPSRIWVFMGQTWTNNKYTVEGVWKLMQQVWPTYDSKIVLHVNVATNMASFFLSCFIGSETLDQTVLAGLSLILPASQLLQENFLSPSELRQIAIAPLMANLDKKEVLDFCILCLELISKLHKNGIHTSGTYMSTPARQPIISHQQAYIEKHLFAQSSKLATIFLQNPDLRPWILNLWTMLVENPDAPSLLAFLSSQQAKDLKAEFASIAANKMESVETVGDLAQFLAASKRQEGLLDLLRTSIMPSIEKRVPAIEEPVARRGIIEALKLSEVALNTLTIEKLGEIVELSDSDPKFTSLRTAAIELLTLQLKIDAKNLESFVAKIATLTPKIAFGAVNESMLIAWCALIAAASSKAEYVSKPRKLDWARRLLEGTSISNFERSEEVKTETAMCVVYSNSGPSVEILRLVYQQLHDLTSNSFCGLASSVTRSVPLLQIGALILAKFTSLEEGEELPQLICDILEVVAVKQVQVYGLIESFLKPQLVIVRECLRLFKDNIPSRIERIIAETATDLSILRKYNEVPTENAPLGELLLVYIQEWLPIGSCTESFVRCGLINGLLDAPLSRYIQAGNVVSYERPGLHSLWRNGVLPVLLRLLSELEERVAANIWLVVGAYSAQLATCIEQWKSGPISLALIDETTLVYALITQLKKCDINPYDVVNVKFDSEDLLKTVEFLLNHQKYLSERLSRGEEVSTVVEAMNDLKEIMKSP